MIVRNTVLE